MMLLNRRQRHEFLTKFNQICDEEDFGQSTWTIDLCYLLRRFNIRHIYTTITIGVNPDFRNNDYYGAILWIDHIRVSSKFDKASCNGLKIQKRTIDNKALLEHLAKKGPVIALTNGYLLHCDLCQTKESECLQEIRKCFSISKPKTRFSGHYIVLCGYDHRIGSVFYRNPAHDDRICVISYRKLTEARTANGTDEPKLYKI
ncbi:protein GUCD1 isoform X2 [Contarinia nasturtii]|nr:protein GUCD1 isoform X2 [Contarinia nasturtii]